MKKILVAILLVISLSSCAGPTGGVPVPDSFLSIYHDNIHGVTCWLYGNGNTYGKAISCLPDSQIENPGK